MRGTLLQQGRAHPQASGGASLLAKWTGAAATAGAQCLRGRACLDHRPVGDRSNGRQQRHRIASLASGNDSTEPSSRSGSEDNCLLNSLHRNPFWVQSSRPGMDLVAAERSTLRMLPHVYVILFGLDNSQQEGIYSLRALGPDGMPQDTIIAFQSRDDADRYACLLEVTMEPHTPHVYSIAATELYDFCRERCYRCCLEPSGTLLIPPDYNVGLTDWERASKLRSGSYAVLSSDPEPSALVRTSSQGLMQLPSSSACTHQAAGGSGSLAMVEHEPSSLQQHQQQLGREQLDALRSQLEALLPEDEAEGGGGRRGGA